MRETARPLNGRIVALAALAVLTTAPAPSGPPSHPADFGRPATAAAQDPAAPRAEPARHSPQPERVLVPAVGLDARVRPVGVTGQGAMAVPADPSVAGWYRFGPVPGSPGGSAVLVGHVDSDTGALGEFAALYDVRPGDRVEVRREGAGPVAYRVLSRTTVPKDELPSSLFRRTGAPVLTLITCAPPFVPEQGGYLSNLVVTAQPSPA
ncbi:class F sortase [Streptomyces sp. YS415]|uniref:class F sortase n=1 Tax=Streptomyces sp. YS415 TaxID=2944806 RepID=UPI0020214D6D|nr:class F sortase [Streptomyces sp. YS415]MCL7428029.1 class F sortase [Streptomyces sp. YS415]